MPRPAPIRLNKPSRLTLCSRKSIRWLGAKHDLISDCDSSPRLTDVTREVSLVRSRDRVNFAVASGCPCGMAIIAGSRHKAERSRASSSPGPSRSPRSAQPCRTARTGSARLPSMSDSKMSGCRFASWISASRRSRSRDNAESSYRSSHEGRVLESHLGF